MNVVDCDQAFCYSYGSSKSICQATTGVAAMRDFQVCSYETWSDSKTRRGRRTPSTKVIRRTGTLSFILIPSQDLRIAARLPKPHLSKALNDTALKLDMNDANTQEFW